MRGDGNCLFHALADQSRERGADLREQIMRFLEQNAVHQDHEEQADAWLREADYLRSDPYNWGGDTAIVAFSLMRQQRITLHMRGEDGIIQSIDRTHEDVPQELAGHGVLHLWYNGRDHYDLLVPSHPEPRVPGEAQTAEDPANSPPPPPAPHPQPRPPKRSKTAVRSQATEQPREPQRPELPDHSGAQRGEEPLPLEENLNLLEELSKMPVAPDSTHPRRKLEEALKHLANTQIRAQPLIPPEARAENVDSGENWPRVFCAFQGCTWSSPVGTEADLEEHVRKVHGVALTWAAQHMPKPIPPDALIRVYNEAVALRCREDAPVAGSSRDRSALRSFAEATSKDNVESLICFSCGCIHPRVADTEKNPRIQWCKLIAESKTTKKLHELLSFETYLKHYDVLAGDVKLSEVEDFEDWTLTIPGLGRILCCPEDHRCAASPDQHPGQHTLCEECELPICTHCLEHLRQGKLPPLSLCNDMWTGYAPKRLHEEKITIMEMICASPCVTTLICMSMEARFRSEGTTLDEQAQLPRHRLGARGNALTFPLPWEDLLRQLQANKAETAAAAAAVEEAAAAGDDRPPKAQFPRSGEALGDVVRMLLKTNKAGKTSEADINTLLHQATVRREVVIQLILDMKRLGHPAYQGLSAEAVREAATRLPESGVPPEVLKVIHAVNKEEETGHKLQPQKAAAPTDGREEDLRRAGTIFANQRARAVVPEGCSQDREDQNGIATAALNDLADQLRAKQEDKITETFEVRTGNHLMDQFQPLYFATAFSFCFKHGTGCPDVQNSKEKTAAHKDEQHVGRRRSRNPEAPEVQIFEYATGMQRRAETQFRRDWTFGFTLWNYLFRTMNNKQQNAFMYCVPDENGQRRALTGKEIMDAVKEIQQKLVKGKYLDVSNQARPINGDLSKVRFAGISPAAEKARCGSAALLLGASRSVSTKLIYLSLGGAASTTSGFPETMLHRCFQ